MKGKISLKDFIQEVKDDLRAAVNDDDPFFIMENVKLEVSFGLDIEAKTGAKFVVFDIGAKTKAQQTHKVTIELTPFVTKDVTGPSGGTNRKGAVKKVLPKELLEATVKTAVEAAKRKPVAKKAAAKRKPVAKKAAVKRKPVAKKAAVKRKPAAKKA